MISLKIGLVLLYCCCNAFGAPSSSNGTAEDLTDNAGKHSFEEASIPDNMNIADYYYSIFGKHLDYDYKEPLLTFDEPETNDLSDEILSEVDKNSDTEVWGPHSRKKRFILVPTSVYNATRRWAQQRRQLRMERRRLRAERRQRWQQNRINYLNTRSEALRRQANRLAQVQQRQHVTTRNAPATQTFQTRTNRTTSSTTSINTSNNSLTLSNSPLITSESQSIPVKQVPIPTKP